MKRHLSRTGVLVLLFAGASYAQNVQVLTQGASSVTLSVTPDSLSADTVKADGQSYLNITFRHGVPEYNTAGSFIRQFIPVPVGVFSNQIQVQVVQTDYRTVSLMQPIRSPRMPSVVSPKVVSEFLSYDGPYESRRHLVSRIKVYPFVYDSLSGSYRMLEKIVFQVTSLGSGVTTESVPTDPLLSGVLANYSQVKDAIVREPSRLRKATASSVLAEGSWYKIGISHSGIYRLTYSDLKNADVPVGNIDMSTVKIYNNGSTELPQDPNAPRPNDLMENAIYVYDANGNNKFDNGDYVLFYGKAPREWAYNPSTKTFSHYIDHYTDSTSYYFMTYGGQAGKRMQTEQSVHAASYYRPNTFTSGVFREDERYNLLGSGKDWFGTELQMPTSANPTANVAGYLNKLFGLDSTQNIICRARVISRSDQSNYFSVYENATGTELGTIPGGTVNYGDDEGYYAYPRDPRTFVGSGNLPNQTSVLKIIFSSASSSAFAWVDWYEIMYKRLFQSVNDVLDFYAPDTNASVYYSIRGFSSDSISVFDLTDFSNVAMMQPESANNGTVSFGIQAASGMRKQYLAVGASGYLKVDNISPVQNSNLHGDVTGEDLVIVTAPQFLDQANQLASFKQSFDGLKTKVVTTTAIYNEFACGIPDPTAIRDYLKYAHDNWQVTPSYVILFGAGTYDYENKVSDVPEYVPPYESDESLSQIGTYASDDYFVQFNAPLMQTPISMVIGRLPARSTDDATAIVNKIIGYESKPDYGDWKDLITFVGDQGITTGGGNDGDLHTNYADDLARFFTPASFDQRKIYLILYPVIISTEGRREPQAAAAIVNQVNQGSLVVNFVGHGSPLLWSYTHVFDRDVTIPQLTNMNRLSLFIAATCDFARDDDPGTESAAEALVNSAKGGAIGVVSSTRVVYASDNATLNQDLFGYLFTSDSLRNPVRIGKALFETKQIRFGLNDIKYQYIGDPSVRLGMPRYRASIDSLNGKSLVQVSMIRALDKLDIKGTVYHPDNSVWSGLASTGVLTVYDSDQPVYVPEWGDTYKFQGSILFRGQVSIDGGRFEARTVIPSDISYSNQNGKIELYFQAGGTDGSGYTRSVTVGGTDTNVTNNHNGPEISVYFDSRNFRNGDVVAQNPTLIVDLHAENGINLSDEAVGHSLQATFDGTQSVDLSPYFLGSLNSYQDGTVTYPVTSSLSYGTHSVTVQAFDVFNNPGEATASFDVESSDKLSIKDVYNYPDPFSSSTSFTFERTDVGNGEPVDVTIRVFTLSGRLIKTIRDYGTTGTFVKVDWNGLDDDGNRLANGVYLYKVIATTIDGAFTSEAIGRMAVVR